MSNNKDKNSTRLHSITAKEGGKLSRRIPDGESVTSLSELLQALSDPTRIKILFLLSQKELCVHDLSTLIGASQSSVSHHLKLLRLNNVVKAERKGKAVHYSLHNEQVANLFRQWLDYVEDQREG